MMQIKVDVLIFEIEAFCLLDSTATRAWIEKILWMNLIDWSW